MTESGRTWGGWEWITDKTQSGGGHWESTVKDSDPQTMIGEQALRTIDGLVSQKKQGFDPEPKKVFYHWKRTTVHWKDGTITTVNAMPGDKFSYEAGFLACLGERLFGSKKVYRDLVLPEGKKSVASVVPVTLKQQKAYVEQESSRIEKDLADARVKHAKMVKKAEALALAAEKKMVEEEAKAARDEKKAENRRQKRILRDAQRIVDQREYNDEVMEMVDELETLLSVEILDEVLSD